MKNKKITKPPNPQSIDPPAVHILPDWGKVPTIGPDLKFYGQIMGLAVGLRYPEMNKGVENLDPRSYALFQPSSGLASVWIIPDQELFLKLSESLNWMSELRFKHGTDYGSNAFWIGMGDTGWDVYTI